MNQTVKKLTFKAFVYVFYEMLSKVGNPAWLKRFLMTYRKMLNIDVKTIPILSKLGEKI